jgi:hypothetical protein
MQSTSVPDAVPPDHDDDHGGDARGVAARGGRAWGPSCGGLGIAIVGGLIVSQMLTLYTTPVVYLYLDRFRLWVGANYVAGARNRTAPCCRRCSPFEKGVRV